MKHFKIGTVLAVALFANSCYSMHKIGSDAYKNICNLTSYALKHNKDNVDIFSVPFCYSPTSLEGTRAVTFDSILDGIETMGLSSERVTFYRTLLREDIELITKEFHRLAEKSVCIEECYANPDVELDPSDHRTAAIKIKLLQMVQASLKSSLVEKQSLILFLAAHGLMCATSHCDTGLILSCEECDPQMEYPVLMINYDNLAIKLLGGARFGAPGISLCGPISGYCIASFNFLFALMHELNHATHMTLGLSNNSARFLEEYFGHSFLRELLFTGYDDLRLAIEGKIAKALKEIGDNDSLLTQFEDNMRMFLSTGASALKLPLDAHVTDDGFSADLAHKLALKVFGQLWPCPEEMNNVIGVLLIDGDLVINTLSDLDRYFQLNESLRWPYKLFNETNEMLFKTVDDTTPFQLTRISDINLELRVVENTVSVDEINRWFKALTADACASGIGLPSSEIRDKLLRLHGLIQ